MMEVKEFVGASREEAVAKAQTHFGVGAEKLEVYEVPKDPPISGLAGRTLVLASIKEEGTELGPVGEFLQEMLRLMNAGPVRLTESESEDGEIVIRASGGALEEMSQREAQLWESLSHLADRAATVLVHEDAAARVELRVETRQREDRGGRREHRGRESRGRESRGRDDRGRDARGRRDSRGEGRRDDRGGGRDRGRDRARDRGRDPRGRGRPEVDEAELEQLARDAADEVRRSGEEKLLREMNSRERWVVHNALKSESDVRSESEGQGPMRRVKIVPA